MGQLVVRPFGMWRGASPWAALLCAFVMTPACGDSGAGEVTYCSGERVAKERVLLEEGEYSNPRATLRTSTVNGYFPQQPFPHGAWEGDGAPEVSGQAGASPALGGPAQTPSTRVVFSREQGEVTRSYIDEAGRAVVEEWSLPPGYQPAEPVALCPEEPAEGERMDLALSGVTVDGANSETEPLRVPAGYAPEVYAPYSVTVSGSGRFLMFVARPAGGYEAPGYTWEERYEP